MNYDNLYRSIRQRSDLSGNAKVVFSWLFQLVRDGLPHPGRRVVASECGIDEKTAKRVLAELEAKGLISTTSTGPGSRPRYVVLWTPTGGETPPVEPRATGGETPPVEPERAGPMTKPTNPNRGRNAPGSSEQPGEKRPRSTGGETPPVRCGVDAPTGGETPATGGETPPVTGGETPPHPNHSKPIQRESRASARNPSSLSGLPDPWRTDPNGVGSLDFVWRMFRLAAATESGEARDVGRSMKDRATNERLELEALKLAHQRAAANGTTVESEFARVVDVALQRFAEEVRESRGRVPWNLGYLANGWGRCARGLEPKGRAA